MLLLVSTFEANGNPELNCFKCKNKYKGRVDYQAMTDKNRKKKGCFQTEGPAIAKVHINPYGDAFEVQTCPGNFYDYYAQNIINLYMKYREGIMPYSGGLAEQPAKIVEAFRLLDNLVELQRLKEEKKQQRLGNGKRSKY
jgi:hypothetical protein